MMHSQVAFSLAVLFARASGFAAAESLRRSTVSVAARVSPSQSAAVSLLQRSRSPGTLEVAPDQLVTYIATGRLPTSVTDGLNSGSLPATVFQRNATQNGNVYEMQAKPILEYLKEYGPRLDEVRKQADTMYKYVQDKEANLEQAFAPVRDALEMKVVAAADEAAKAEVQSMLERLTRIHYQQLAVLERSAQYWEERVKCEKQLSLSAEAAKRLEEEKAHKVELDVALQTSDMLQVRNEEKARLDAWVADFEAELHTEEHNGQAGVALLAERTEEEELASARKLALLEISHAA